MPSVHERADTTRQEDFDPFDPAFLAGPYATMARFRADSPVFYSQPLNYWVLTRYHDVRAAFRDTATYSASNAVAPMQPPCRHAAALMAGMRYVPTLTNR